MSQPAEPILEIARLSKHYGDKCILDDVDLNVARGELCSVVGPSGCGKSTMLRLILGQERQSSGTLRIDGEPAGLPNVERGVVYQRYSLYPHLSVVDNVLLGNRLSSTRRQWRQRREEFRSEAIRFLAEVGLDRFADHYPHELSGGMQQRVAVVQALIMKPKILLMDEPFGALDPGTREDVQLFLLELWETHAMTIFFVTHDMEEAVFLGSRLLVLSQHYTDDRGDQSNVNRGAKLVADHLIKPDRKALATAAKATEAFAALIADVRREGFDPGYLQHARDFNLKHPMSIAHPERSE